MNNNININNIIKLLLDCCLGITFLRGNVLRLYLLTIYGLLYSLG
jgi:hypothetical protein